MHTQFGEGHPFWRSSLTSATLGLGFSCSHDVSGVVVPTRACSSQPCRQPDGLPHTDFQVTRELQKNTA